MRKILIATLLVIAACAPRAAFADDAVPDGQDCRDGGAQPVTTVANGASEPDRLALCIHVNGSTILYIGGELQSEDPNNDGFAGTCGAIIVADLTVAAGQYGDDWHNDHFDC
jgi:hypothetical protein